MYPKYIGLTFYLQSVSYTPVICSTEENWFKLRRLIRYLFGTRKRKLKISAEDITWMNIFIDSAYAVHPDMKSHTGR